MMPLGLSFFGDFHINHKQLALNNFMQVHTLSPLKTNNIWNISQWVNLCDHSNEMVVNVKVKNVEEKEI